MILTRDEIHPKIVLPGLADRQTAARTSSFVCWLACLWFFLSPWAFFGVSEQPSAWNSWGLGGFMLAISIYRLIAPRASLGFSWVLSLFGVWVMCSPWIFGYSDATLRMINSLGVGAVLIGFSTMSRILTRELWRPRSLQSDNSE